MRRLTAMLMGACAVSAFAAAAQAEVVVATVGPMTGQYAKFGEQMKRGAELAIEDLNAKGGVGGEEIRLEIGDDACDARQAVAVANQMAGEGVAFIAGHFCSSSSIPASDVYAEEGILQMSPASTNPELTERGLDNVFRVCGRDDVQGIYAANYVVDNKVATKVAIIHDKSAYGKGLADEFKKELNAKGVQEVMYEAISQGDKDFSALITKMKGSGVELIYLGGYHTEAGLIVRQSREQGFNAVMMSGDALVTDEYWQITGDTGEGTLMTFAPDPRQSPEAGEVVARFKEDGYDPEGYTLYTYAALQVWADAVSKAGSTELEPVVEALRGNSYNTVLGPIAFDENGDVKNPEYVMYKWSGGAYKQL